MRTRRVSPSDEDRHTRFRRSISGIDPARRIQGRAAAGAAHFPPAGGEVNEAWREAKPMTRPVSPLDRWPARVAALLIAAGALATLLHIHRNELFPSDAPAAGGAPDPFSEC